MCFYLTNGTICFNYALFVISDTRIFSTPFRDNHVHNSFTTSTMSTSSCLLSDSRFSGDNFRQDFHNRSEKTANFVKPVYLHNTLLHNLHYMFILWLSSSPMTTHSLHHSETTVYTTHLQFPCYRHLCVFQVVPDFQVIIFDMISIIAHGKQGILSNL